MRLASAEAHRRLADADHGFLATVHPTRGADVVPVCFAVRASVVGVPIDRVKAKGTGRLGRERNLAADPRATLLCERWDAEDWSRLWWVRATMTASDEPEATRAELASALTERYVQYRTAPFARLLTFRITEIDGWAAS